MTIMEVDERARQIPGEALRLVEAAATRSLTLRVTGSVAVGLHCPQSRSTLASLGRRPYHDIDYWAHGKEMVKLERFFETEGYLGDPQVKRMHEWGIKRLVYLHPDSRIKIDVFMDELVMAQTIPFSKRLSLGGPCVSVADLVLSKLQIHEMTDNDLMDLVVLFIEHDATSMDLDYVTDLVCSEWGFWYDARENLQLLRQAMDRYVGLPDGHRHLALERVATIEERLEQAPKDRRWRMRARIGTRKRWYELVGDVDR
jgi:hypothetical protein